MTTLNLIMLIDDGEEFNFLNEITIRHANASKKVVAFQSANEALKYLDLNKQDTDALPDLILLDINMPLTDGWGFLDAFGQLKSSMQKLPVILMLTSSSNPEDKTRALGYSTVSGYYSKPLLKAVLEEILQKFF